MLKTVLLVSRTSDHTEQNFKNKNVKKSIRRHLQPTSQRDFRKPWIAMRPRGPSDLAMMSGEKSQGEPTLKSGQGALRASSVLLTLGSLGGSLCRGPAPMQVPEGEKPSPCPRAAPVGGGGGRDRKMQLGGHRGDRRHQKSGRSKRKPQGVHCQAVRVQMSLQPPACDMLFRALWGTLWWLQHRRPG